MTAAAAVAFAIAILVVEAEGISQQNQVSGSNAEPPARYQTNAGVKQGSKIYTLGKEKVNYERKQSPQKSTW